ncbi:MAG: RNA methyltransferase [Bacteroidales bacterium]|nr:RNA methyltransferase [Bacteroidales bacterium]MBO7320514.1 RNA methyltransferase [Bacteroidales bacterium]
MFRKLSNIELNRLDTEEYKRARKLPVTVVLDNVRSQHNIGSAFRTSDAFLVEKVVLCGICAVPPTPEIHKSALGAEFSVEWDYRDDAVQAVSELRDAGYTLIGVEQTENSTSLEDLKVEDGKRYALVFGNEVKGVNQQVIDMCDECLEIPQWGTKHSLNVSVSAGVVLWEFCKKLRSINQ